MSKFNFETDPNLGQALIKKNGRFCYCFGVKPVKNIEEIIYASGFYPNTKLCSFKFIPQDLYKNKSGEFIEIKFVNKNRSKRFRSKQNPSGWWVGRLVSNGIYYLDSGSLYNLCRFSLDKFFQSDLFEKYMKIFSKKIKQGIDNSIKLVNKYQTQNKNEPGDSFEQIQNANKAIKSIAKTIGIVYDETKQHLEEGGYPNLLLNNFDSIVCNQKTFFYKF